MLYSCTHMATVGVKALSSHRQSCLLPAVIACRRTRWFEFSLQSTLMSRVLQLLRVYQMFVLSVQLESTDVGGGFLSVRFIIAIDWRLRWMLAMRYVLFALLLEVSFDLWSWVAEKRLLDRLSAYRSHDLQSLRRLVHKICIKRECVALIWYLQTPIRILCSPW